MDVTGKLHDMTEFHNVVAYSDVYGVTPRSTAARTFAFPKVSVNVNFDMLRH